MKQISVKNTNSKLRNTIVISIALIAAVLGVASLLKLVIGGNVIAENSSGLAPNMPYQELFAWVKEGEHIEGTLTVIADSVYQGYTNLDTGMPIAVPRCTLTDSLNPCDPTTVRIDVTAPGMSSPLSSSPSSKFATSYAAGNTVTINTGPSAGGTATATTAGVWNIKIYMPTDLDGNPYAGALNMRFKWDVRVVAGTTAKDGRIWAENVVISQIVPSETVDSLTYYIQRDDGYRYKIVYSEYNGYGADLRFGAFGLGTIANANASPVKCISSYKSTKLPEDSNTGTFFFPDPNDNKNGTAGRSLDARCGGTFKIFFSEPDSDLPETESTWFNTWTGARWISPELQTPEMNNACWTSPLASTCNSEQRVKAPSSSTTYAGTIKVDTANYYGNATLFLDTNGDNSYTGSCDRQIVFGIDRSGTTSIPFDGKDGCGANIPLGTWVNAYIVGDRVGEAHSLASDIELRGGGIQMIRLAGSGIDGKVNNTLVASTDAQRSVVFWDDTDLSSDRGKNYPSGSIDPGVIPSRLLSRPADTDGGAVSLTTPVHSWDVPVQYSSTSCIITTNPPVNNCFDHFGWSFSNFPFQSWGDNRIIEDWTYDVQMTEALAIIFAEDTFHRFRIDPPDEVPEICKLSEDELLEYMDTLSPEEAALVREEWLACPGDPPPPPPDLCRLSWEGLLSYFNGDEALARAKYDECHPSPVTPPTGSHRYY